MAVRNGAMRMGALNLLVLIIAISLAVLSVLSLVTANASENLSERQAVSTNEVYAEEIAGQSFLELLNERLQVFLISGTSDEGMFSELRMSIDDMAQAAANEGESAGIAEPLSFETDVFDVSGLYEYLCIDDPSGETQEALDGDLNEDVEKYMDDVAGLISSCVGGVRVEFTTQSGHSLNCVIGITPARDYVILGWRATAYWASDAAEEVLLMG